MLMRPLGFRKCFIAAAPRVPPHFQMDTASDQSLKGSVDLQWPLKRLSNRLKTLASDSPCVLLAADPISFLCPVQGMEFFVDNAWLSSHPEQRVYSDRRRHGTQYVAAGLVSHV